MIFNDNRNKKKSYCRPRIRADDWTLVITATEARDAGTYECRCKENVKKLQVLYMILHAFEFPS